MTPYILAALALLTFVSLGQVAVRVQQHGRTRQSIGMVLTRYAEISPTQSAPPEADWRIRGAWLAATGQRFMTEHAQRRLRTQLDFAGHPETAAVTRTVRNKVLIAIGFGILAALFASAVGGWAWLAVPLAIPAGFWLPDLLIYNAVTHRTEEITRGLPDALELLNLCVESGMGFQSALAHVSTTFTGPVAEEFARVLREMQLGKSRVEALQGLAMRTRQEDLLRLVNAIVQADRLGIAISGVLGEQASEMRSRRSDRARESAQKVPVKILVPVIVCFLPGIFIIVLGPAAMAIGRLFAEL